MSEEVSRERMAEEIVQSLSQKTPEEVLAFLEGVPGDDVIMLSVVFLSRLEPQIRKAVGNALWKVGEVAYNKLINRFAGDTGDRVISSMMLQSVGPAARPALMRALSNPNARIRLGAAETLGKMTNEEAVPVLIRALSDSEATVSKAARDALVQITGKHFLFGGRNPKTWQKWWESRPMSSTA